METPTDGDRTRLDIDEQFVTDDGRELAVTGAAVHPLVLAPERVSHHLYHRPRAATDGHQFVVFSVSYAGFDGETATPHPVDPGDWVPALDLDVSLDGERYAAGRTLVGDTNGGGTGRFGVPVPVDDADAGAVVWRRSDGPSPRWRLPEPVLDAVARRPQFAVQSVEFPDEVRYDDPVPVTFTVANTGGREGRFLVELDAQQGSLGRGEVTVSVPAGSSVTHTTDVSPHYSSGMGGLTVVFDWGREKRTERVSVTDVPTVSG